MGVVRAYGSFDNFGWFLCFFGVVLGLFGVVCDDLAFVLRLGFSCVDPVCSPILSLVLRLLSWQLLFFLCHCVIRNASYDCLEGRRCFGASIPAAFSPSQEGQVLEVASTCGEIGVFMSDLDRKSKSS